MSALDSRQQKRIRELIRSSTTFRRWFNSVHNIPRDQLTMRIENATDKIIERIQKAGDGFTFRGRTTGMILLSTEENWAGLAEFETVIAHEMAHAAAGLRHGTPAECYSDSRQEQCATTEQNKVHRDFMYFRDRTSYADTGPFNMKETVKAAKSTP